MRESKADVVRDRDRYRQSASDNHMAVRFLVLGVKPDFEETVRWRDHGDDFVVTIRGYGLARGDGGVVVEIWGELDDAPMVGVVSTLKVITVAHGEECCARSQYQLAAAYERLRQTMARAVQEQHT